MLGKEKTMEKSLEHDGEHLKVVRVGPSSHKEDWKDIERLISQGWHVVGVVGNANTMNLGFVLLEKNHIH